MNGKSEKSDTSFEMNDMWLFLCAMSYTNHVLGAFVLSISISLITNKKKKNPEGYEGSFLLPYSTKVYIDLLSMFLPFVYN